MFGNWYQPFYFFHKIQWWDDAKKILDVSVLIPYQWFVSALGHSNSPMMSWWKDRISSCQKMNSKASSIKTSMIWQWMQQHNAWVSPKRSIPEFINRHVANLRSLSSNDVCSISNVLIPPLLRRPKNSTIMYLFIFSVFLWQIQQTSFISAIQPLHPSSHKHETNQSWSIFGQNGVVHVECLVPSLQSLQTTMLAKQSLQNVTSTQILAVQNTMKLVLFQPSRSSNMVLLSGNKSVLHPKTSTAMHSTNSSTNQKIGHWPPLSVSVFLCIKFGKKVKREIIVNDIFLHLR